MHKSAPPLGGQLIKSAGFPGSLMRRSSSMVAADVEAIKRARETMEKNFIVESVSIRVQY